MTKALIIAALVAEKIPYSYNGKTKTFHVVKNPDAMLPESDFNVEVSLHDKKAVKEVKKANRKGEAIGAPRMALSRKGKILAVKHSDMVN